MENKVVYNTNNVQLKINDQILGKGKLVITENLLMWQSQHIPMKKVSIHFEHIEAHGICTPQNDSIYQKSMYIVLDHKYVWKDPSEQQNNGSFVSVKSAEINGEQQNDCNENEITEIWLFPDDSNATNIIYQTIKDCQVRSTFHYQDYSDSSNESSFTDANLNIQSLHIHNDRFENAEESRT